MREIHTAVLALVIAGINAASPPAQELLGHGGQCSMFGPEVDAASRPNIVFILTDDQDVHLESLKYMPLVKKHLLDQGTYYNKHYCTTAVCCPSRVTLWTGKAAHNTNITDVNPPYGTKSKDCKSDEIANKFPSGGYPKFVTQGFNENYLPVWLQQEGYNTYYTGKLFNVHTVENYHSPEAAGFTGSVRPGFQPFLILLITWSGFSS